MSVYLIQKNTISFSALIHMLIAQHIGCSTLVNILFYFLNKQRSHVARILYFEINICKTFRKRARRIFCFASFPFFFFFIIILNRFQCFAGFLFVDLAVGLQLTHNIEHIETNSIRRHKENYSFFFVSSIRLIEFNLIYMVFDL